MMGSAAGPGDRNGALVTIGMPVYNGENFVGEAIESLRSQTFQDFRLIIADNHSIDATEDICRSAAKTDDRIDYHRHARNLGAAANYNYVLGLADSRYFMWHAHDDARRPEFLQAAIDAFSERPSASVVFSLAELIDSDGDSNGLIPTPRDLTSDITHRRFRSAMSSRHPDVVLFGLMKMECLRKTGGHRAYEGGDRVLIAELALLGDFFEIPEPLFQNRDHPHRYVRIAADRKNTRARRQWWDTDASKKGHFQRWRALKEYIGAARNLGAQPSQNRFALYLAIARSIADNRGLFAKQLFLELLDWVLSIGHRRRYG